MKSSAYFSYSNWLFRPLYMSARPGLKAKAVQWHLNQALHSKASQHSPLLATESRSPLVAHLIKHSEMSKSHPIYRKVSQRLPRLQF